MKKLKKFFSLVILVVVAILCQQNINAATSQVDINLPVSYGIDKADVSVSMRKTGSTDWTKIAVTINGDNSLTYSFNVEENESYEYVANFYSQGKYYKIKGSNLMIRDDNTYTNTTSENALTESYSASKLSLTLNKLPVTNKYNTIGKNIKTVPANEFINIRVYDTDKSEIPLVLYSSFASFRLPYGNGLNTRTYEYKVSSSSIKDALGKINVTGATTTEFKAISGHTVTGDNPPTLNLELKQTKLSLGGLIPGSSIDVDADSALTSVNIDGNTIEYDLNGQSDDILNITIKKAGFSDVLLKVKVDENSQYTILNDAQIKENTRTYSVEQQNLLIKVDQLLELILEEQADGSAIASSVGFSDYINYSSQAYPGIVTKGAFKIVNNTGRDYTLIDYDFEAKDRQLANMYRIDSEAIKEYYKRVRPDILMDGTASYIFDFEKKTGKSLYDGLLDLYKLDNPKLTKLEDLPASELASIFGNNWQFYANSWGGDPNADYAVKINDTQFAIKELDNKMIKLAQHHLFNNSLSLSFDTDVTGALASSSTNADKSLLYSAYEKKTTENQEQMNKVMSKYKVIKDGNSMKFNNFASVSAGDLIHDAYRPSQFKYNFNFKLMFKIIGIDGTIFHDKNKDGIYQSSENTFKNIDVQLLKDDTVVEETKTNDKGYYQFNSVATGDYKVKVIKPSKYEITSKINQTTEGNKFKSNSETDVFNVSGDDNYHKNAGLVDKKTGPKDNGDSDNEGVVPKTGNKNIFILLILLGVVITSTTYWKRNFKL